MPEWAHQLLTFAVLGLAVAWFVRRWLQPASAASCSRCPQSMPAAGMMPTGPAGGRRSSRLKILD
jgi:hypothetical protein